MAHYLRENSPNGDVTLFLLQHFAKEFRMKSDCLLRETIKLKHELHPREVHTLLRIIASASGSEKYANVYPNDQSLFINVSSLLRCIVSAGKEPDGGGLDKPMTKLEEVALTSDIDAGYEKRCPMNSKRYSYAAPPIFCMTTRPTRDTAWTHSCCPRFLNAQRWMLETHVRNIFETS